jgi:hypothetical protein
MGKKKMSDKSICERFPAPAEKPLPGEMGAIFDDPLGEPARRANLFASVRAQVRISGLAGARLEALAMEMGHRNLNAVAKLLLEAAAGIEAEDFYILLSRMTETVQQSAQKARRRQG